MMLDLGSLVSQFIMIRLYSEIMPDFNRILDIELTLMYYDLYYEKVYYGVRWILQ